MRQSMRQSSPIGPVPLATLGLLSAVSRCQCPGASVQVPVSKVIDEHV